MSAGERWFSRAQELTSQAKLTCVIAGLGRQWRPCCGCGLRTALVVVLFVDLVAVFGCDGIYLGFWLLLMSLFLWLWPVVLW